MRQVVHTVTRQGIVLAALAAHGQIVGQAGTGSNLSGMFVMLASISRLLHIHRMRTPSKPHQNSMAPQGPSSRCSHLKSPSL